MIMAMQRMDEGDRDAVKEHFLALPMHDRSLRFGVAVGPAAISAYVERIDLMRDAIFGIRDRRRVLVGVAHLAVEDKIAELGLSVLPEHRRRGLASALFTRAAVYARSRLVPTLLMRFLWSNEPVLRIARRFGMNVVAQHGDAVANLTLNAHRACHRSAT
ncbi:MAG TPA: GNAT family N-acetyltransferase [Burkholderiales bacterium]